MLNKFKKWYYHRKAKNKLIKQYEYLAAVNEILEKYISEKILTGGSKEYIEKGRQNLITKQAEIRENTSFLEFLHK